jgi:oxygen-independent coproporphyrinogen III oxidase
MNHSLYVHIPFCKHRCHYCDFNTYAGKESLIPDYVDALIRELRIANVYLSEEPVHSIYFGGGTPSLVEIEQYGKILKAIDQSFTLTDKIEISIEVNPGTLTRSYLDCLQKLGFNRISVGVQSTNPFDLTRLDRIHNINDILEGVRFARQVGFSNINLDLIFNLPWQDLSSWERSLSRAIDLAPEHFSVYALIIEPGTPLFDWYSKGLIAQQDQDLEAEMFETTMEMLNRAGYVHYEISNWAKLARIEIFVVGITFSIGITFPMSGSALERMAILEVFEPKMNLKSRHTFLVFGAKIWICCPFHKHLPHCSLLKLI